MELAVKAASAKMADHERATGTTTVRVPGAAGLRGDRGRRGPGDAQRGRRPGRPRAGARRPRPGRRGARRAGRAPGRLRGSRDPRRAVVRARRRTRWPARCGGSTCSAAGCTPTRGPPPPSSTAAGRTCRWPRSISGVVDPPGPDEVRALVDEVLGGVVVGDFADTLFRAAAFARVAAAGRVHDEPPRTDAGLVVRHGRVGLAAAHPRRPARARGAPRDLGSLGQPWVRLDHGHLIDDGPSACRVGRASGRGSPGSQHQPLRAATRREALPARRTTSPAGGDAMASGSRASASATRPPAAALRTEGRRASRSRARSSGPGSPTRTTRPRARTVRCWSSARRATSCSRCS